MPEIPTHQSFNGFIASDPVLKHTTRGEPRLYFVAGKEHWARDDTGELVKHDSSFHHLALYGRPAEHAYDHLAKGDWIIADGRIRTYTRHDGTTESEFNARRIGHDLNRTTYTLDRTPRSPAPAAQPEHTAATTTPSTNPADRDIPVVPGTDVETVAAAQTAVGPASAASGANMPTKPTTAVHQAPDRAASPRPGAGPSGP